MPFVAAIVLAAGLVWGLLYARRGSLALGAALTVAVGYVLGYNFWHAHVGPLPFTLDRVLLVGLVAALVAQWRWSRLEPKPLAGADWLLAALLVILGASALLAGQPEVRAAEGFSPMWRLVMSFVVPAVLYWIVRQAPLARRQWVASLAIFAALGVYLALTGLAEITGQWSLVFPRYISDPTLGIHFGRARGPELNAASLGVYLTVCLWCTWFLRPNVRRGWQLVLIAALPLMALAVVATLTRSTWLGLLASAAVVGYVQLPTHWRLPLFTIAALGGVLIAAATWNDMIGLQREGTASESEHSVDQRKSFAYVSWQMFKDHPVFGVGFGRFYDRKLPYLSDRSQDFELDSLRTLHHHNTLLSLVTETGMVGLAAFVALLAAWARSASSLVRDAKLPVWMRSQGLLMLAVLVTYLSSALFHDLTLLPSQEWILFLAAGFTMNLRLATSHERTPGRRDREFTEAAGVADRRLPELSHS
jgi:O-antigen ligase